MTDTLASREVLLEYFKTVFKNAEETGKHLKQVENLLGQTCSVDDDSEEIQSFLSWSKNNSKLRVVETVFPLDSLQNATLYDIKVLSRGPDDLVYDRDASLRAKIARGNCVLEYKDKKTNRSKFDLIIYALRKFTGGLGDEDEIDRNNQDWKKYFLKDLKETKRVVAMQKANGEAAHMSCRFINGQFFISAGSKNVHLLFQKKSDIEKYSGERYQVASLIAEVIERYLSKMEEETKRMLLSFLASTKLTIIFEILNPETQHVEDLSNLKEPMVKFITFCSNKLEDKPKSLCLIPPDTSIEIATIFGLSCVRCKNVSVGDVDNYIIKVRKDHGHEGVVLYFLDSDENVIGLLKKKTIWYIILRAIREKLRHFTSKKSTQTLAEFELKVISRLDSLQQWLGFSENDLKNWKDLAIKFVRWFNQNYVARKICSEDISSKYPVLWNQFLQENGLSDKMEITITKEFVGSNLGNDNDEDLLNNLTNDIEKL